MQSLGTHVSDFCGDEQVGQGHSYVCFGLVILLRLMSPNVVAYSGS